mmetsp:Transcript_37592/g.80181  ORF Transcript_37592/g.80181 Transcript_37592/m.80181 type:complete len:384 (-) Transcript_37592:153-1304(-)
MRTKLKLWLIILVLSVAASLRNVTYFRLGTTLEGLLSERGRVDSSLRLRDTSSSLGIPKYGGAEMPKLLWMYWDKGLDHLESLSNVTGNKYAADYSCVKAMMMLNPSWDVKLLNETSATTLAPIYSSLLDNETLYPKLTPTMKGDTLRLELLSRYGGVYADTSICPFVGLDDFIPSLVGSEKNGFWANPADMSRLNATRLLDHPVAMCHDHSRVPAQYRGKRRKGKGAPFRTSSNWFMASTNPHNPLVDEWLNIYVNHLLTLPDPTVPYFLTHCALTQARMMNKTVDVIWSTTMERMTRKNLRRKRGGFVLEKTVCKGVGRKANATELEINCAIIKKPPRQYVLSGEYWNHIQTLAANEHDKQLHYTPSIKPIQNTIMHSKIH